MYGSFFRNDNAVNVVIGYILNLIVLIIITGTITGAFFLFVDSSAKQSMRAGYTDMGSEIARDITNVHLSNSNFNGNTTLLMERPIPLTIGGRGYSIELRNGSSNPDGLASVVIKESGFLGYKVFTKLNLIDADVNISGEVYSGSGLLNLTVIKNQSGEWIRIK